MGFARATALPVFFCDKAILPVRIVLERLVKGASRLMGGKRMGAPYVTAGELKAFVRLSGAAGRIDSREQDMLEDVIDLGEMRIKGVMVPRVDMAAVDLSAGWEGVLQLARSRRVSKVVVYEGSPDNVLGFVAVKDLL